MRPRRAMSEPRSVLADLEDGPLRRELGFLPEPPPPPAPPPVLSEALRFSGTGGEYFRIWIVGVLLTLLTLGVYSAWAKVRKARWFARHTVLAGDAFDFHGEPWRILLGRALALALLLLWGHAFDFGLVAGLAVLGLFAAIGPLLFASAQRFKLANTSWRGLRFGFEVPRRRVYAVCVPLLAVWVTGTVLAAAGAGEAWVLAGSALALLALPSAHARLKLMQHAHARFGAQRFAFRAAGVAFYGLYAKALVLGIVGFALGAVVFGLIVAFGRIQGQDLADGPSLGTWLAGIAVVLVTWVLAWPYFAARLQQIVWGHTTWGGVRFAGQMRGGRLFRLVLGNTALVLLTCGLYWPFAAVAIARYRVESVVVEADAPLAEVHAQAPEVGTERATGDAAADFFGLDLGW
jgi:uncharacterized membrane protein YjgN (DUF898 family)